ncbi:hypothetical protein HYV57_04940 [Candidatus Peregrinibacteria bacterium]|nr:hypothetical protein [Candidatus Peregrinibacteria bacterium]
MRNQSRLDTQRIDEIQKACETRPFIGTEAETIIIHGKPLDAGDPASCLQILHKIGKEYPTTAIKKEMIESLGERGKTIANATSPDVPQTIIESHPEPFHSPAAAAAAERLMAIINDMMCQRLSQEHGLDIHLLAGAAWRPPHLTENDVSPAVGAYKQAYYRYQIGKHGDKVGAAAGSHLNLSAPWAGNNGPDRISREMIRMTGLLRLIAVPLSIALSAASPMYYGSNGGKKEPQYMTKLTPFESARLGHVWPGRTIMDTSELFRDLASFRKTLGQWAKNGTLLTGRDIWLPVRAQAGHSDKGKSFEEISNELNIPFDEERIPYAQKLITSSFKFGLHDDGNPYFNDKQWKQIEKWRQKKLKNIIAADRNRVELRVLEAPPAFPDMTPFEYLKSIYTFIELLFIYLSEEPQFVGDLQYGENELAAAKSNETAVLEHGLDAELLWIPGNMKKVSARKLLAEIMRRIENLAQGLGCNKDLDVIRKILNDELLPPAARIRKEIAEWYNINVKHRHNSRFLPDDSYPLSLLARNREAMKDELAQIIKVIPSLHPNDKKRIEELVKAIEQLNTENNGTKTRSLWRRRL